MKEAEEAEVKRELLFGLVFFLRSTSAIRLWRWWRFGVKEAKEEEAELRA